MNYIEIEELLKVGAHFGHPTRKWNPKFSPYIATKKNGVHIDGVGGSIINPMVLKLCILIVLLLFNCPFVCFAYWLFHLVVIEVMSYSKLRYFICFKLGFRLVFLSILGF